jgi:hypothetical protein
MKQEFGGMGIANIRDLNISLLSSWVKRFNLDDHKLWKEIIQYKYKTQQPNLLACKDMNASPFWKGVMWAFAAAKFGYQWMVGNGQNIKFWEDQWFGGTSLAIHFWELYIICNEQTKTIKEIWDGNDLRLSFRRCFDDKLLMQWGELKAIVQQLQLTDEPDQMVWKLSSTGVYSSQSLYAVVNFRGIKQVFVPAVWKLNIPPRVQVFYG